MSGSNRYRDTVEGVRLRAAVRLMAGQLAGQLEEERQRSLRLEREVAELRRERARMRRFLRLGGNSVS